MSNGFGINVLGADRLSARFAAHGEALRDALPEIAKQSAAIVTNAAKEGIRRGPKTGRVYTARFPYVFGNEARAPASAMLAKPHQASAQGEYPAANTGNLMRSVHDTDAVVENDRATSTVRAEAAYAAALEFKPEEKGGRPFLRRATFESQSAILDLVERMVRERTQ